eukprot:TRINITY_DN1381_c0_g1_i1.p1 TRINITY_DN1381_c0_g1~~TRINITY_DN1381_c0_g1_i1.p1  ORF type:complete len:152 (-),score=46.88 TRINITY_DN1381_c0_g1_i1:91-546(-)
MPEATSAVVIGAARVTVAYALLFVVFVNIQLFAKVASARKHRAAKKAGKTEAAYNRYDTSRDLTLHVADRIVGNYVEWASVFLATFWLCVIVTGQGLVEGWIYVIARALYPLLAFYGGVTLQGAKPLIFLSTVPGYGCLISLFLRLLPFIW